MSNKRHVWNKVENTENIFQCKNCSIYRKQYLIFKKKFVGYSLNNVTFTIVGDANPFPVCK